MPPLPPQPGSIQPLTKSPFQLHVDKWGKGCGSECCPRANRIVHARGKIPCNVLCVGEAPGVSEDVVGQPFVGPAGKLLDEIIKRALGRLCVCPHEDCTEQPFHSHHRPGDQVTVCPSCGRQQAIHNLTVGFCNLVGCLPTDGDGEKGQPSVEAIMLCAPPASRTG